MNALLYSSYARHENPHLIPISGGNNQPQSLKSTHRQPCLAQPTHIHPSLTQQTLGRAAAVARHRANEPCQFRPVSSPSHGYCPSPEHHCLLVHDSSLRADESTLHGEWPTRPCTISWCHVSASSPRPLITYLVFHKTKLL